MFLACSCSSQGSTQSDSTSCNGLCPCNSNGECYCNSGYIGDKCDSCDSVNGYFTPDVNSNGETICEGTLELMLRPLYGYFIDHKFQIGLN